MRGRRYRYIAAVVLGFIAVPLLMGQSCSPASTGGGGGGSGSGSGQASGGPTSPLSLRVSVPLPSVGSDDTATLYYYTNLGGSVIVNAQAQGGTPPYIFLWTTSEIIEYYDGYKDIESHDDNLTNTFPWPMTKAGNFSVICKVIDDTGDSDDAGLRIVVIDPSSPCVTPNPQGPLTGALEGIWISDHFGVVSFDKWGSATYTHGGSTDGGYIGGTLNGAIYTGTWRDVGGARAGKLTFTFNNLGMMFHATWSNTDGSGAGTGDAIRVTTCPQ